MYTIKDTKDRCRAEPDNYTNLGVFNSVQLSSNADEVEIWETRHDIHNASEAGQHAKRNLTNLRNTVLPLLLFTTRKQLRAIYT